MTKSRVTTNVASLSMKTPFMQLLARKALKAAQKHYTFVSKLPSLHLKRHNFRHGGPMWWVMVKKPCSHKNFWADHPSHRYITVVCGRNKISPSEAYSGNNRFSPDFQPTFFCCSNSESGFFWESGFSGSSKRPGFPVRDPEIPKNPDFWKDPDFQMTFSWSQNSSNASHNLNLMCFTKRSFLDDWRPFRLGKKHFLMLHSTPDTSDAVPRAYELRNTLKNDIYRDPRYFEYHPFGGVFCSSKRTYSYQINHARCSWSGPKTLRQPEHPQNRKQRIPILYRVVALRSNNISYL